MNNNIVTGSAQANAGQQAIQIALQQQAMAPPTLAPEIAPPVAPPTIPPPTSSPGVLAPGVPALASENGVKPEKKTWKKDRMHMLYMFYLALVLIGALNWGIVAVNPNYNPVEILSNLLNTFLSKIFGRYVNLHLNTVVYGLVAVSALILLIQRDVWLPFLGKSVLPSALVPFKDPISSDTKVTINTSPNAKIAYWASLPMGPNGDSSDPDVATAYGDFSNGGVIMSDSTGVADLSILAGTGYHVPSGKMIPRHVHYRVINDNGMMGRIRTKRY